MFSALRDDITAVWEDRELLRRLRAGALASAGDLTSTAAGEALASVHRKVASGRIPARVASSVGWGAMLRIDEVARLLAGIARLADSSGCCGYG